MNKTKLPKKKLGPQLCGLLRFPPFLHNSDLTALKMSGERECVCVLGCFGGKIIIIMSWHVSACIINGIGIFVNQQAISNLFVFAFDPLVSNCGYLLKPSC